MAIKYIKARDVKVGDKNNHWTVVGVRPESCESGECVALLWSSASPVGTAPTHEQSFHSNNELIAVEGSAN